MNEILSSEVTREGEDTIIRVHAEGLFVVPSIEDEEMFMSKTIE